MNRANPLFRIAAGTAFAFTLYSLSVGWAAAQMMGRGMMGGGMMSAPSQSRPLPTPAAPGARAFQATCATCHGLPDPRQHTAAQWPAIVRRMEQYMRATGTGLPGPDTLVLVTRYLEDHAAHARRSSR